MIRIRQDNGTTVSMILLSLLLLVMTPEKEARGATTLIPSFSLSEGYTDNLFFSSQDEQFDFTTVLSPSLGMVVKSKNIILTLVYDGAAQFHLQHPEADGYFQSLSFGLDLPIINHYVKGLEVRVSAEISYSPELQAFSFENKGTETDVDDKFNQVLSDGEGVQQSGRINTFRRNSSVFLRYPWSRNFMVSASYSNVITRYSRGRQVDTNIHSGFAEGQYRYPVSPRTAWMSSYGISATSGEGRELIHQIETGAVHRLSSLASVDGTVGISFVEDASPEANLDVGVSKRYKRGDLNLRYARNIATGLGVVQGVTKRQSFIGSATYLLGKGINSSIQFGYANNKSFEGNEVDVASYTAEGSLSKHFFSWLNGTLNYTYLNQQSKGAVGENGERNVVSFTLTAVGPSWRMAQ